MHLELQYIPYVIPLAVTAVIAAALTLVAWRRQEVPAALPFVFLCLSIFEWSVGYGLELTFADLPSQVFWAKIEYFGIVSLPLAWLAFALLYTGHEQWLTLRRFFLFSIVPLITLTLVWTNDWHGLIWSQTAARSFGSASIMSPSYGAWFWVHTAYSYLLILAGSILILQTIVRSSRLYHGQAGVLVISALAPWVGNALYLTRISPFSYLDLTPFAFTVSGLALAWDLARYQLLNIVPVARSLVVESMNDAVLVLDARNRIVDLNPAAERLLRQNAAEVIGAPVQLILSAWRDLVERYVDMSEAHDEVALDQGAERRWFDLRISPLRDRNGRLTGRLVVAREVTERMQSEKTQTAAYHISEAAHSAQNLDELFHSVHGIVGELMPAHSFYIALYDSTDDLLTFPYWADEHDPVPAPARPGKGLTEYVIRTGEPLLAGPTVFQELVKQGEVEEIGAPSVDWLGVPLETNGKTIGVLAVQTYAAGRLGEQERKVLAFVSEQVAMAIERVRAEEALRRARDELEVRVAERTADLAQANASLQAEIAERQRAQDAEHEQRVLAEALSETALAVSRTLDVDEILDRILANVGRVVPHDTADVVLIESGGTRIIKSRDASGRGLGSQMPEQTLPVARLSKLQQMTETGQPYIVPDTSDDPDWIQFPETHWIRSHLDTPIHAQAKIIGFITLNSATPNLFTSLHAEHLQAFADQAGVAFENARLLDELKQSLAMSTRLYELSSQILTAPTTEETARLVTETLRASFGADAASIQIIDALGQVESNHSDGLSATFHQKTTLRPNGMTMTAWRSSAPVIVNDPQKLHPLLRAEGVRASIALPLRGEPANLGVVFLNYRRPHVFSEREVELLSLFANQAALALKRVRLVEETRQRALEQSTLSEVARALNAELDVRQAFPAVVASLRHLTHCDHASITLLDADNREYTVAVLDEPRMEWKPGDRVAATASNTTVNLLAGRPHVSRDLNTELDLPLEQTLYLAGVRSRVVLPLMAGATVLGGLNLTSTLTNTFDEAQLPLLQQIANAVAISVENSRLFEAEQTRRAELTALYDLSRVLADAPPDSDSLLELVARHAVETILVTFARVLLLEKEDLVVRSAYPRRVLDRDLGVGTRAAASEFPFCQRVMESNDPEVVCAGDSEMTFQEYDALFLGMCQSICVVPLRTDGRSLGLIVLGEERSEEREPFTPEKIRLARSIGDQAASALHRAELFDEVEKSYLDTVLCLANAVEAKDSYTADHVQNVARMAIDVGREVGMSQRELAELRFGAILHDIGKIGIPDAILKKPASLDADEWEIMRQHPVIGERILAPIAHLREAAQIVRHHHEKYDGSGYPDGLVGEAIPLGARILTVVDSYSAIVDRRTYKPARSHEQAVAELSRCAGTQFDPYIVDLFLRQDAQRFESRPEAVHSA